MATAVVIPAYKPDESLLDLLRALRERTFIDSLVVVDDGSGPQYESIFAQAAQLCTLKRHAQNRGKGAAIRTGLEALGGAFNVVTADCEGSIPPAISKKSPVPLWRAGAGVRASVKCPCAPKWATRLPASPSRWCRTAGFRIRKLACVGIPQSFLEVCRQLEGDRYEYEMHMLLEACRRGLPIREVEIETVYIDNNRGSHFHTLRDGKRIYRLLLGWKKKLRAEKKKP